MRAHGVVAMVLSGRGPNDQADRHLELARRVPGMAQSVFGHALVDRGSPGRGHPQRRDRQDLASHLAEDPGCQ